MYSFRETYLQLLQEEIALHRSKTHLLMTANLCYNISIWEIIMDQTFGYICIHVLSHVNLTTTL